MLRLVALNQRRQWIHIKGAVHSVSSVLNQQSGVHMNSERGFPLCNHSSCSYWILKDKCASIFVATFKERPFPMKGTEGSKPGQTDPGR